MEDLNSIQTNLAKLLQSIAETAASCGRSPDDIKLILVSKTVPEERILQAYQAGARVFGENKVQELVRKDENLPADMEWHFIGRLQTNKVKYLLGDYVDRHGAPPLIHSVDREELAVEIENRARKRNISKVPCLIQVNSSGEESKAGFELDQVSKFVAGLSKDTVLDIQGLMTIGPLSDDLEKTRSAFKSVKKLQEELIETSTAFSWNLLSMGMSGDYDIAIEEGANLLRVGSAVFGERVQK